MDVLQLPYGRRYDAGNLQVPRVRGMGRAVHPSGAARSGRVQFPGSGPRIGFSSAFKPWMFPDISGKHLLELDVHVRIISKCGSSPPTSRRKPGFAFIYRGPSSGNDRCNLLPAFLNNKVHIPATHRCRIFRCLFRVVSVLATVG